MQLPSKVTREEAIVALLVLFIRRSVATVYLRRLDLPTPESPLCPDALQLLRDLLGDSVDRDQFKQLRVTAFAQAERYTKPGPDGRIKIPEFIRDPLVDELLRLNHDTE